MGLSIHFGGYNPSALTCFMMVMRDCEVDKPLIVLASFPLSQLQQLDALVKKHGLYSVEAQVYIEWVPFDELQYQKSLANPVDHLFVDTELEQWVEDDFECPASGTSIKLNARMKVTGNGYVWFVVNYEQEWYPSTGYKVQQLLDSGCKKEQEAA